MFHRPLGCTAAAVLPNQDSGTSQILVNPTQVREEMGHPVFVSEFQIGRQVGEGSRRQLRGSERGEQGGRGRHQLPQGAEGLLGAVQANVRHQEVIERSIFGRFPADIRWLLHSFA